MTSTTIRSTPNLTVPSTQNTAPVLEFRCLYTHDVRRKSKRWQDGFLRFHTFNKRVMVYDVPRNFIGDMHWRQDGTVEDGDELELEKGVLVQVGEAVGRMEQDLTELFEKRRVPNESPRAKKATALPTPCPSSGHNVSTPFTQLRPKSLNALLGTPRGRYGRAMLPTLSPYEERHQARNPNDPEEGPSVKRQKMNPPPFNTTSQQSPTVARARPCLPDRRPIPEPAVKSAKSTVQRQKHQQREVIEVDSGDEGPPEPKRNSFQPSLGPTARGALADPSRHVSPLFCSSSPPVSTTNHLPPTDPVPSNPHAPTEPSAAKEPAESDDSVPVNPLRPAARRPRKKLMYKDLLPPKRPHSSNEPDNTPPTVQTAREGAYHDPLVPPAPLDELSTFHTAQRKRLDARMRTQQQPSDSNPPRTANSDERRRFSDGADDTTNVTALPLPPQLAVPPLRPPPPVSEPMANTADENTTQGAPQSLLNTATRPPRPFAPSAGHLTVSLRRSDSAPNPSHFHSLPPPAPAQPIKPNRDPPTTDQNSPAPNGHERATLTSKAKSPLRKWASLPLPLPARPTGPVKAARRETGCGGGTAKPKAEVDHDTGPWSREAADLFAWRPPSASATASASKVQID